MRQVQVMSLLRSSPLVLLAALLALLVPPASTAGLSRAEAQEPVLYEFWHLQPRGSEVFFAANDGRHGREPWVSDGTPGGTRMVADVNPGPGSSRPGESEAYYYDEPGWATVGGRVYFVADDGEHGRELWRTDGTARGTRLVLDIRPGPRGAGPSWLTPFKGRLFFAYRHRESERAELWSTDGTRRGTVKVSDDRGFPADPNNLHAWDGRLYMSARGENAGQELWSTDGSRQGTGLVKDLREKLPFSNQGSGWPTNFAGGDTRLYFTARVAKATQALWRTDGTRRGTVLVKEIWTRGGGECTKLGRRPDEMVTLGDRAFFRGRTCLGHVAMTSDGTPEGTLPLQPEDGSEQGRLRAPGLEVLGDVVVLNARPRFAEDGSRGEVGLWRADGSGTDMRELVRLEMREKAAADGWVAMARHTVFGEEIRELWRTDGTVGGTAAVATLPEGSGSIHKLTPTRGPVFFLVGGSRSGLRLWTTDGTAAGTRRVFGS